MPNLRYTTGLNGVALARPVQTCGSMIANFCSAGLAALGFLEQERVNQNRLFPVRATGITSPSYDEWGIRFAASANG